MINKERGFQAALFVFIALSISWSWFHAGLSSVIHNCLSVIPKYQSDVVVDPMEYFATIPPAP